MDLSTAHDLPEYLRDLNPPQMEAVTHFEGPILVLAGAGSGKTRVLTRRVAHLILAHHVRPQNILAVTFTNKATEEMRGRLRGLLGERADNLWAATFHSTALRMLRQHGDRLGYKRDFAVYDEQDSRGVLKEILKELRIDEKKHPVQSFSRAIDSAKNSYVLPDDFASVSQESWRRSEGSGNYFTNLVQEVYHRYQGRLLQSNAMDFGDLLVNIVRLLEQEPRVLEFYRQMLHFILVDEFQDTNKVQYRFVNLLSEPRRNLLVVGDDDQSIYAFRGATIRNILEFEKDYPNTRIVFLEQNYRSTGNVLTAAHAVIKRNLGRRKKKLWTAEGEGDPIVSFVGVDESDEAEFIAGEVKAHLDAGGNYRDIAVFYRTNAQSRALEEVFVNHSIPYRIYGGLKFYERKEVKDILAYLKLAVNPSDNQSFLRVVNTPPRGIGAQTVQSVIQAAAASSRSYFESATEMAETNKGLRIFSAIMERIAKGTHDLYLSALIALVIEETGYADRLKAMNDPTAQSRLENLRELEAIGRSMEFNDQGHHETLVAFLDRVSLTASDEAPDESGSRGAAGEKPIPVSLMTLHLAKGLEFPLVFLTGMEEGLIPHYRALYNEEEIEEERRLCYVGITRAMRRLYLTRAFTRGMFASGDGFGLSGSYREMSRFVYDIPEGVLDQRSSSGSY